MLVGFPNAVEEVDHSADVVDLEDSAESQQRKTQIAYKLQVGGCGLAHQIVSDADLGEAGEGLVGCLIGKFNVEQIEVDLVVVDLGDADCWGGELEGWDADLAPVVVGHGEDEEEEDDGVEEGGEEESVFEDLVPLLALLFDQVLFGLVVRLATEPLHWSILYL